MRQIPVVLVTHEEEEEEGEGEGEEEEKGEGEVGDHLFILRSIDELVAYIDIYLARYKKYM